MLRIATPQLEEGRRGLWRGIRAIDWLRGRRLLRRGSRRGFRMLWIVSGEGFTIEPVLRHRTYRSFLEATFCAQRVGVEPEDV